MWLIALNLHFQNNDVTMFWAYNRINEISKEPIVIVILGDCLKTNIISS